MPGWCEPGWCEPEFWTELDGVHTGRYKLPRLLRACQAWVMHEAMSLFEARRIPYTKFYAMSPPRRILTLLGAVGVVAGVVLALTKTETHDQIFAALFVFLGCALLHATFRSKTPLVLKLAPFFAVAFFVATFFMFFPTHIPIAMGLADADGIANSTEAIKSWMFRMPQFFPTDIIWRAVTTHDDVAAIVAELYFVLVALCGYVDNPYARRHFGGVYGSLLFGGSLLSVCLVLPTNWFLGEWIKYTTLATTIAMAATGIYGVLGWFVPGSRTAAVVIHFAHLAISFVGGCLMLNESSSACIDHVAQGDVAMYGRLLVIISAVQLISLLFIYIPGFTDGYLSPYQEMLKLSFDSFCRDDLGCEFDKALCARAYKAVRERDPAASSKVLEGNVLSWQGHTMGWLTEHYDQVLLEDKAADKAAAHKAVGDSDTGSRRESTQQLRNGARANRSVVLVTDGKREHRRVFKAKESRDCDGVYTKITLFQTPRDGQQCAPEPCTAIAPVEFSERVAWPSPETIASSESSGDLLFCCIQAMYQVCTRGVRSLFKYEWAQRYHTPWIDGKKCGEQALYGCGAFSELLGVGKVANHGNVVYVRGNCVFETSPNQTERGMNRNQAHPPPPSRGKGAPAQPQVEVYEQPREFYDLNKCRRKIQDAKLLAGESGIWDICVFCWLLLWSAHTDWTGTGRGLLRDKAVRDAVRTLLQCRNLLAHNNDALMSVEEFTQHTSEVKAALAALDNFALRVGIPGWVSLHQCYVNCVGERLSTSARLERKVQELQQTNQEQQQTIHEQQQTIQQQQQTIQEQQQEIQELRHAATGQDGER